LLHFGGFGLLGCSGKADQTTHRIKPFTSHLMHQGGSFPKPLECLSCSKGNEQRQGCCQRTPHLTLIKIILDNDTDEITGLRDVIDEQAPGGSEQHAGHSEQESHWKNGTTKSE